MSPQVNFRDLPVGFFVAVRVVLIGNMSFVGPRPDVPGYPFDLCYASLTGLPVGRDWP